MNGVVYLTMCDAGYFKNEELTPEGIPGRVLYTL